MVNVAFHHLLGKRNPRIADPDALALRLAAILASVLLGPILDARVPELFGVKTARAKLDALRTERTGP